MFRISHLSRTASAGVVAISLGSWLAETTLASTVNIETVHIGNTDNAADTTGFGAVAYEYDIGKYEVTAGQYTEFLNAVAGVDTNALYKTNMSDMSLGSGISRSGGGTVGNPYTYSVNGSFANRPVNWVSFWDACRFANWLHNGQPTGAQNAGTTEDGTYTLTPDGVANNTVTRNTDTTWAVTSEDEWYKAAYHMNDGNTGDYFDYPTSSNTAPGRDMADPLPGNNANHYRSPISGPYPIDSGKYTTSAAEFQNSASPYGTFDQGGNVWEWTEAIIGSSRGLRGGSFDFCYNDYLIASARYSSGDFALALADATRVNGFRVSHIPEPASLAMLTLGGAAMLVRRRGRNDAA